ncbi:hypothetical protein C1646_820033 [Rhizophagus diaphanus]|nr:hypothetical protein C1646_820033 [Rhizophagus diaphanus] [Rhizophagus sp. MUCL 43196]
MSYSKIFSGDLPELIFDIIKYFYNDYSTLYSCVLVNRLWCRITIPILWENPFSIPIKNYNVIGIYLHYLNDDLKTKLNKYYEINKLFPSTTLFNYPMFLKILNIYEIISSVDKWSETFKTSQFKKFIYMSLFKIFIENEVNLHTLEIEIITYFNTYVDYILEIILQYPIFIHKIRNLKIYILINDEDIQIKNRITQMIDIHQNLKKIMLSRDSFSLYQPLILSNGSNTLNTIILYFVDFNSLADNLFEKLNVLESVHIMYCTLNNKFIQQIVNLTKPFKLKSLLMYGGPQIESLKLLLQKSGDYLENFGYGFCYDDLSSDQQSLQLIINYCKNIKFLDLYKFGMKITYLVLNLIENFNQNLNHLSITVEDYQDCSNNIKCSSIILQNLGQILPSKLEYLNLVLYIRENDLEIFLKNSQNTSIKKLLILQKDDDDIIDYIKKFIMKEKRVKYLAIWNSKYEGLPYFENEVKEFELYNIKLKYYYDLSFNLHNFEKELD